jgi:hypothetical protein
MRGAASSDVSTTNLTRKEAPTTESSKKELRQVIHEICTPGTQHETPTLHHFQIAEGKHIAWSSLCCSCSRMRSDISAIVKDFNSTYAVVVVGSARASIATLLGLFLFRPLLPLQLKSRPFHIKRLRPPEQLPSNQAAKSTQSALRL